MNFSLFTKQFNHLKVEDKIHSYYFEPHSSVKQIGYKHIYYTDILKDFAEDINSYGFSPFLHLSTTEQKHNPEIMKYKTNGPHNGYLNFIRKTNKKDKAVYSYNTNNTAYNDFISKINTSIKQTIQAKQENSTIMNNNNHNNNNINSNNNENNIKGSNMLNKFFKANNIANTQDNYNTNNSSNSNILNTNNTSSNNNIKDSLTITKRKENNNFDKKYTHDGLTSLYANQQNNNIPDIYIDKENKKIDLYKNTKIYSALKRKIPFKKKNIYKSGVNKMTDEDINKALEEYTIEKKYKKKQPSNMKIDINQIKKSLYNRNINTLTDSTNKQLEDTFNENLDTLTSNRTQSYNKNEDTEFFYKPKRNLLVKQAERRVLKPIITQINNTNKIDNNENKNKNGESNINNATIYMNEFKKKKKQQRNEKLKSALYRIPVECRNLEN